MKKGEKYKIYDVNKGKKDEVYNNDYQLATN